MNTSKQVDKYLSIVKWARNRYTHNKRLIVSIGGKPSIYSRIEEAAFEKYLRFPRDASGALLFKVFGD